MLHGNDKRYNIIAYACFFSGCFLLIPFMLLILEIIIFENKNYANILGPIIAGLSLIYYKIHTKPISQAIKEYLKNKKKEEDSNIKTYKDYKEKEKEK